MVGRASWDAVFGWSPVPILYIFVASLLLLLLFWLVSSLFRKRNTVTQLPFYKRFFIGTANIFVSLLAGLSLFLGLFLVQWGYNYCRPSLETEINLHPDTLNLAEIQKEATRITASAAATRRKIVNITDRPYQKQPLITELEPKIRACLTAVLADFKYPTPGRVRGRELPAGTLLSFNTAGVYLPWVGEGHIDGGLHPLQKPFTLAHELAHGYGFTDEGTCNFLAYLACLRCSDPYVRYSGELTYWRYVFSALRQESRSVYLLTRARIPSGMHNDLAAIKDAMARYPDRLKGLQASAYDGYLKSQGIQTGMGSYDYIVQLTIAWRKKRQALGYPN